MTIRHTIVIAPDDHVLLLHRLLPIYHKFAQDAHQDKMVLTCCK